MGRASAWIATAVALGALLGAECAAAGRPSLAECFEGSDFIANAARSRDAGMSEAAFVDRMEQDFIAIQSVPSDLRWFVHDPDDEVFLLAEARVVFVHPGAVATHQQMFLQDCVDRMAG
jgi:hypothetical protein